MNERGRLTKIRKAFVMAVHAGAEQECDKRHNPVRPELEKVLKDHGVSNCPILPHPETRRLSGYAENENEEQRAAIAFTGVCQKWWKHTGDAMPADPGLGRPFAVSAPRVLPPF